MAANNTTDEPRLNVREQYHPAVNVSPKEVGRAMGTLNDEEYEQINRMTRGDYDIENADRVLVSLDAELAQWIQRRAWECDRDPEAVIDAFVKHGYLPHEEIMDSE